MARLGVDRVRLTAGWNVLAPDPLSKKKPQFNGADPNAYPQDQWSRLDRAVRAVTTAGLDPQIDVRRLLNSPQLRFTETVDESKAIAKLGVVAAEQHYWRLPIGRSRANRARVAEPSHGDQQRTPAIDRPRDGVGAIEDGKVLHGRGFY